MKILHTADWHLGVKIPHLGKDRIEEHKNLLNDIKTFIQEENIDVVVIAGDIFDAPIPPVLAEKLFYNFIADISGDLKKTIIAINGNHDSIEKIESINIIAQKVGRVKLITLGKKPFSELIKEEENFIIHFDGIDFLAFPFTPKFKYSGDYQTVFESFVQSMLDKCGDKVVLITHDEINGATYSSTETVLSDKSISIDSIGKIHNFNKILYWALGHIHKHQEIISNRAYYAGSILEINFSEIKEDKGFIIVEIDNMPKIKFQRLQKYFEFKQIYISKEEDIEKVIEKEKDNENTFIKLKISDNFTLKPSKIEEIKKKIKNVIIHYSQFPIRDSKIDIKKFNDTILNPIELFKEYCKMNNKKLSKDEENKLKEIYEEVKLNLNQ